jgi:hypothetical protein
MAGYQPGAPWRVGPFDVDDELGIDDGMAQRNAGLGMRQNAEAAGRQAWDEATRAGDDLQAARPADLNTIGLGVLAQGSDAQDSSADPEVAPQPIIGPIGDMQRPAEVSFGPAQTGMRARRSVPQLSPSTAVHPASRVVPPRVQGGGTITYGALQASAPSDSELAELRRQQAAFANTTRKIDLQNSWFAAPVLAAPLVPMGLEAAAAWAARTAAPEVEQAPFQFLERDPYPRVGDNWATRAGRRAHDWLEQRLLGKEGWDYEPKPPNGSPLRPDVGTPQRNAADPADRYYLELKPNTPTGRAAAARAVKKYKDATGRPVRPIYYDPKDFI